MTKILLALSLVAMVGFLALPAHGAMKALSNAEMDRVYGGQTVDDDITGGTTTSTDGNVVILAVGGGWGSGNTSVTGNSNSDNGGRGVANGNDGIDADDWAIATMRSSAMADVFESAVQVRVSGEWAFNHTQNQIYIHEAGVNQQYGRQFFVFNDASSDADASSSADADAAGSLAVAITAAVAVEDDAGNATATNNGNATAGAVGAAAADAAASADAAAAGSNNQNQNNLNKSVQVRDLAQQNQNGNAFNLVMSTAGQQVNANVAWTSIQGINGNLAQGNSIAVQGIYQ